MAAQQPIYSNSNNGQVLGGCPRVHHTPWTSARGCLFPSYNILKTVLKEKGVQQPFLNPGCALVAACADCKEYKKGMKSNYKSIIHKPISELFFELWDYSTAPLYSLLQIPA